MTAKEYLTKIKSTSRQLVALGYELEEIRSRKEGLTGIELSEKVKKSATYHNSLDDLIVQEEEVLKELREVRAEWWKCRQMIRAIDDPLHSDVLRYYYLLNDDWEKVADKVHRTKRQVHNIHGHALQDFRRISKLS